MNSTKNIWVALIAVGIIALGSLYSALHSAAPLPGGTTNYDTLGVSGLKVGTACNDSFRTCTGTTVSQDNSGYCDLNFGPVPASFAASTTVDVDCQGTNLLTSATAAQSALTGVAAWSATAGGEVSVTLASSTPGTYLGVFIEGCSASSTAGYITCQVANGTGAAFTPATTTTHWLQYRVTR